MCKISIATKINMGGGLTANFVKSPTELYQFVDDGVMVYTHDDEPLDKLIEKIQAQDYNSHFKYFTECDTSPSEFRSMVKLIMGMSLLKEK